MRILIISPVASHPQNQGNSARIAAICRQLQSLGHIVHFLYYPLEGLTLNQRQEMSESWDYFHSIPCDLPNTQKSLGDYFGIDDWYDPRLGDYAAQLHERWCFDIVVVNYVWFSRVLDSLPDTVFKIIDTHDVFGDRHLRFTEIGLEPEWFYTTVEEERVGLTRADLVIAIRDEEEAYFVSTLRGTKTQVTTIGHIVPPRFSPWNQKLGKPVIGYLGSGNPFNVKSLKNFSNALQGIPTIQEDYRFVVAGTICDKIKELPPFEIMGRLDEINDFYMNVDVTINPMVGGTGLKIKTLEALSFGKIFVGTNSAFAGIPMCHATVNSTKTSSTGNLRAMLPKSLNILSVDDVKFTYLSYISTHVAALKTMLTKACNHDS